VIGFVTMVVIASIVTVITGPNDPRKMRRDLLSPLVHRFLPEPDDKADERVAETLLVNETVSEKVDRRVSIFLRGIVELLQPARSRSRAGCIRPQITARWWN